MRVLPDRIKDSALHITPEGWRLARTFYVVEMNSEATMTAAGVFMQALYAAGIPIMYSSHPSWPFLIARQYDLTPPTDKAFNAMEVVVTYWWDNIVGNMSSNFIEEWDTSITQEDEDFDVNGLPILVPYYAAATAANPHNTTATDGSMVPVQYLPAKMKVFRASSILVVTRSEYTHQPVNWSSTISYNPGDTVTFQNIPYQATVGNTNVPPNTDGSIWVQVANLLVDMSARKKMYDGAVNSLPWRGEQPHTWFCTGIKATTIDGGNTYKTAYSFIRKDAIAGWTGTTTTGAPFSYGPWDIPLFLDRNATGQPMPTTGVGLVIASPDQTKANGFIINDGIKEADFNLLGF